MNQNKSINEVQNYLNRKQLDIVDILGIVTILIIAKDIFKKNSEVGEFIKFILKMEFPSYVIKSRTLMAARASRVLMKIDDEKIMVVKNNISEYLKHMDKPELLENRTIPKRNKKKNENQKLEKWLKGL